MLEKRTFQLGVDTDSSLTGVEQGFARWMVNCFIDNGVDLSNIRGNLEMQFESSFTFFTDNPYLQYKCIGSKYDPVFQKNYFFVSVYYPSNSFIFEYDVNTGIINVVCSYEWNLGFDWYETITGISITHIDTATPLLYWSQKSGLKKINVLKAKLAYASNFTDPNGYQSTDKQIVDRIKYPPRFAPKIRQVTDLTFNGNNIDKRFFQFSYRNIFDDYEYSVPSDWSRVNIPYVPYGYEETFTELYTIGRSNNCILITLKKPFETVKKIDLIAREKTSNVGLEINYDWNIYETLDVADIPWDVNDEYIYKFYNDKVGKLITQVQANQLFDNVPLQAVGDTFAEDSRMYNGNITEGFDLEDIDVDVEFIESEFIPTCNEGSSDLKVTYNPLGFDVVALPASVNDIAAYGTIAFQFNSTGNATIPDGNYNFQYIIQEADLLNYPTDILANIQVAFNAFNLYPTEFVFQNILAVPGYFYISNGETPNTPSPGDNQIISAYYYPQYQNCLPQFKNRHTHYFGIYYNDDTGRRSSIQTLSPYPYSTRLAKVLSAQYTINHKPPIWATQYNIAYGSFNAGNYYQIKIISIGAADENGNFTIKVDWLNTGYRYKDITYLKYTYSVGDRVNFLYGDKTGTVNYNSFDLAVLAVNTAGDELTIESTNNFAKFVSNNNNFLAEIYKKSTFSELYYTIDKNDIGDAGLPTRYHKGNVQNQDFLLIPAPPAIQKFKGVNTYIRPRFYTSFSENNVYYINEIIDWLALHPSVVSFYFTSVIYEDAAKTIQIGNFSYNDSSFPSLNQLLKNIVDALNDSANWNSLNPSYSQEFFVDNYTASVEYALQRFAFKQSTDFPVVYFEFTAYYISGGGDSKTVDAVQSVIPMFGNKTLYIEDRNQSDIFVGTTTGDGGSTNGSAVTSFGKPNIINENFRRITRENTIWHSEQLIPETNVNGLSSYPDGNFKDYTQAFGSIQKLFSTDTMLKVFMEQRVGYIPINRYLTGGGGNALTLNNDTILTKMEYYQELRGVGKHPESHAHFSGADYFVDPVTGAICRISRDGITVISDTKNGQGNYTVRKFLYNAIKNHAGNFYGGFNERRNSYEVVIGDSVIVWDEQKNSFSGARSYAGEMLGNAGIDLLSFKNGRLYLHEANQVYNNFFNRQFNSEVWVVGNQELVNKVYTTLRLKSTTPWSAEISNDRGQFSMLIEKNFTPREKVWYAQIKRDMNTVNVTPPAIINGSAIRDIAILIRLINSNIENEQIKYVEINQVISN